MMKSLKQRDLSDPNFKSRGSRLKSGLPGILGSILTGQKRQTSTHYIALLVRQAEQLGHDVDALLRVTGIPRDVAFLEDQWIDVDQYAALVKEVWRLTDNETFGFDPTPLKRGTWALACEFMMGAETLGELLRKGERVLSYLAPDSASFRLEIDGESARILPGVYSGPSDPQHFLMEFMCVVFHRFPSWAADFQIPLLRACFPYSAPQHAGLYPEIFRCEIRFDQPHCQLHFNSRHLQKPIVRTEQELMTWLKNSPADLLYLPGRETSIQSQLKSALKKGLRDQYRFPAFDTVCADLCMSPQVVRRRLGEEGTSYQKIKDGLRADRAQTLLANPDLPVADIAEKVGFSEAAAFSRAFKKWTGHSPAEYRSRKRSGQH